MERRLEEESSYRTVMSLTRETTYRDTDAGPGARYRLYSVNGLGEELMLGETMVAPSVPLAAWPLPYRDDDFTVSFASTGRLGGGPGQIEVSLHDVAGRRVASLASESFAAGYHRARWNGDDDGGRRVAPGAYFLHVETGGGSHELKVMLVG